MTEADALNAIRRAVLDEGRSPPYHREIMRKHRKEWPELWRAIDALLAARTGDNAA